MRAEKKRQREEEKEQRARQAERRQAVCNNHLSGNLTAYRPELIAKIGQTRFDALMGPHKLPKWKRDDYIRIRDEYRAKLKELKQQVVA